MEQHDTQKKVFRKQLSGVVVSNRMTNTVVVSVNRYVKHPKFGKYIKHKKRYKAETGGQDIAVGSAVIIESTRPISKDKHFKVISVSEKNLSRHRETEEKEQEA